MRGGYAVFKGRVSVPPEICVLPPVSVTPLRPTSLAFGVALV
jgi:hypothetical protein